MGLFDWLGAASTDVVLPDIFPVPISQNDFVSIDVNAIYNRILTDVLERTQGIPEAEQNLLWDNCLASNKQDGLVTMLSKAMTDKTDLFLVYNRALKLIIKADQKETELIKQDYKAKGESNLGVFISFKTYKKTDLIKFYSMLEYCAIGGFWKQSNISKALQIKINDLRASVSLTDAEIAKTQVKEIATALASGKDIYTDAKDQVVTASPDLTATQSTIDFIAQKRSFYLGMPASYLTGEAPKGLGDSGKGETKAVERGLKGYYFSIAKPVIEGIFKITTTFKSEDSEGISTALEALKTFDITSNEHLSSENKTLVVNKLFGFDESEKGDKNNANVQATATGGTPITR